MYSCYSVLECYELFSGVESRKTSFFSRSIPCSEYNKYAVRLKKVTWRSGYCYLNKGEYNLNQSKDDSFVEQVAKNNS